MFGPSARLSRYTPAIFACAFVNLLLAELAIVAGLTWPAQGPTAPMTLVAVHLATLGWMTLLMFGALFQFVPVISNRPLPSQSLVFAVLLLFEAGLWVMLAGFVGLTGAGRVLLPIGGLLVSLAVVLALVDLLPPLIRSARRSLPARCTLVGLGMLLTTLALGLSFAAVLGLRGFARLFGPLLVQGLSAHLLAGLGGWLSLTAVGVSYKLLPMFLLAPEERGALGEAVFATLTAGCVLGIAGAIGAAFDSAAPLAALQTAGLALVAAGLVLYLIDVVRIYRGRRRRSIELHNRAALAAFTALLLSAAAMLLWRSGGIVAAPLVVVLVLSGWLTGLGLTQLYKIVAFLSWLTHYGSRLGSGPVPRVQDLVRERRGSVGFVMFFAGATLQCSGAVLPREVWLFRIGAGVSLAGALWLGREYLRAWRRHYAADPGADAGPSTQPAASPTAPRPASALPGRGSRRAIRVPR